MSESNFEEPENVIKPLATETELEDKTILCIDCNSDFTWSIGEQVFFRDKQLQNPPNAARSVNRQKTNAWPR